jgi:hypothetical protein
VKEKINTAKWALSLVYQLNPIGFLSSILIDIIGSLVSILLPVAIGFTVNHIVYGNISVIFIIASLFIVQAIIQSAGNIIKAAISAKTQISGQQTFLKITQNIPRISGMVLHTQ